jgi:hypothetical protein
MIIMAALSVITGSAILWSLPNYSIIIRLPITIKIRTIVLIFAGALLGWLISLLSTNKRKLININISHYASCIIWFLVPLSSQFILSRPIIIGHNYLKIVDQAWLERIGGQGSYNFIIKSSSSIIKNSPVLPNSYLIISILAAISLISITLVI